jgi:hypothetical protein
VLQVSPDHTVSVADGRSDIHVMLRVNSRHGFTVAVSDPRRVTRVARRTVVSDSALGVLVLILEDAVGSEAARIRGLFRSHGLLVREWEKARTDRVAIRDHAARGASAEPAMADSARADGALVPGGSGTARRQDGSVGFLSSMMSCARSAAPAFTSGWAGTM